jgi:hypothetical protein
MFKAETIMGDKISTAYIGIAKVKVNLCLVRP